MPVEEFRTTVFCNNERFVGRENTTVFAGRHEVYDAVLGFGNVRCACKKGQEPLVWIRGSDGRIETKAINEFRLRRRRMGSRQVKYVEERVAGEPISISFYPTTNGLVACEMIEPDQSRWLALYEKPKRKLIDDELIQHVRILIRRAKARIVTGLIGLRPAMAV